MSVEHSEKAIPDFPNGFHENPDAWTEEMIADATRVLMEARLHQLQLSIHNRKLPIFIREQRREEYEKLKQLHTK